MRFLVLCALGLVATAFYGCSILAPSDEELRGGQHAADGAIADGAASSDATSSDAASSSQDAASVDATSGKDSAACLPKDGTCTSNAMCCSGLCRLDKKQCDCPSGGGC